MKNLANQLVNLHKKQLVTNITIMKPTKNRVMKNPAHHLHVQLVKHHKKQLITNITIMKLKKSTAMKNFADQLKKPQRQTESASYEEIKKKQFEEV